MKRLLARLTLGTCAAVVMFAAGTASVNSASLKLNGEQLAEAVEHGKSNFDQDQTAFRFSYINNLGFGYPQVLMRTEYLAVSDYVRRSEYQRKYGSQRVHKLTDERIDNARREVDGQLQFLVTVYGPSEDFMNDYKFHLMAGDKSVMPAAVDMPVAAGHSGFQGKLSYSAIIMIDFPAADLTGNETVKLIVQPPKGLGPSGSRDASFEAPFDLSAVK